MAWMYTVQLSKYLEFWSMLLFLRQIYKIIKVLNYFWKISALMLEKGKSKPFLLLPYVNFPESVYLLNWSQATSLLIKSWLNDIWEALSLFVILYVFKLKNIEYRIISLFYKKLIGGNRYGSTK